MSHSRRLRLFSGPMHRVFVDGSEGLTQLRAVLIAMPMADTRLLNQTNIANPIHPSLPMDDEAIREIAVEFVDRLDARLQGIDDAIRKSEFETVASEAHLLNGASGTIGFMEFVEPAKALEQAATVSDVDQAAEIFHKIVEIASRICVADHEPGTSSPASPQSEGTTKTPIHCQLPFDDDRFKKLARDFIGRFDDRLKLMQQLCGESKFAELASEAHWLKGSGGTIGFPQFTELALALEQAAKRESMSDSRIALESIVCLRERIVLP